MPCPPPTERTGGPGWAKREACLEPQVLRTVPIPYCGVSLAAAREKLSMADRRFMGKRC
jgi:hypothetical protein